MSTGNGCGEMRKKYKGMVRYIWTQIIRGKIFTLLIVLMPCISILSITQLEILVQNNERAIQKIYENAEIRCSLVKKSDTTANDPARDLMSSIADELVESGYIEDVNADVIIRCDLGIGESTWENAWLYGVMSMEGFEEIHGWAAPSFQWLEGYSGSFFEKDYEDGEYEQAPEILISSVLADAEQLSLGDYIDEVHIADGYTYADVRVVGIVNDRSGDEVALVPASLIFDQRNAGILNVFYYKNIYFSISSDWNAEYEKAAEIIQNRLFYLDGTMLKVLDLIVYDEELKLAVKPLDQTVKMVEKLEPFLIGVLCVCEAGLTGLFLLLRKKEIQIMRILGTPNRRVWFTVCGEYLVTGAAGVIVGVGLSGLQVRGTEVAFGGRILFGGLLLLISVAASAVTLAVLNKKRDLI